jgi:hypothetical protein
MQGPSLDHIGSLAGRGLAGAGGYSVHGVDECERGRFKLAAHELPVGATEELSLLRVINRRLCGEVHDGVGDRPVESAVREQ